MNLIPEELKIQRFPCPNCGQIVSSEVDTCKFCSMPLGADVKKTAIGKELDEKEKINLNRHKNMMVLGLGIFMFGIFLLTSIIVQSKYSNNINIDCLTPILIIAGIVIMAKGYIRYREEKRKL